MASSKMPKNPSQPDHRAQGSKSIHLSKAPELPRITNFPVSKNDPICRKWPTILRTIVRKMNLTGVSMIACVRRGESTHPRDSRTTVLVVCNSQRPPSHREKSTKHIRNLLDDNKLWQVEVEFVQGDFVRGGPSFDEKELDRRVIQLPSMPGQSIALRDAHGSGTLGGFLELKLPGESGYRTMGLTCFHCLNPSETGLEDEARKRVRFWRQEGLTPDDRMRADQQVQHPSPTAVKTRIKYLKDEIRAMEDDKQYIEFCEIGGEEEIEFQLGRRAARTFCVMIRTLSELRSFLRDLEFFQTANRGSFGRVFASSGFRVTSSATGKTQSNLDWALIEIPHDRIGENITPDGHYLKDCPMPDDLDEMPLFIHGQRSGYCKGKKHPLETATLEHEIEDGKPIIVTTLEHTIWPERRPQFSQPGDSGALVFTDSYVVVGMLFAGSQSHPFSFFTPIENLIQDIKNITKATDVRLKVNRRETSP
ncbi:unnamed protein product [Penicillium glandicola]